MGKVCCRPAERRTSEADPNNSKWNANRRPKAVRHVLSHPDVRPATGRLEVEMLFTIAVILLIAWLLGVVGTYTIGAFVHVLLVIAVVLFIVGLVSGRRRVL